MQFGFVPGRKSGRQAQVGIEPDIELEPFAVLGVKYTCNEANFIENDRVALQFVNPFGHDLIYFPL